MTIIPKVADFYHGDEDPDFQALKADGMVAIFLKASQGADFKDPTYARRRYLATEAGLLVGAYHFLTVGDVAAQVEWFLKCAGTGVRYALDWEKTEGGHFAGMWGALRFLDLVEQITGQTPWLYAGELLRGRTIPPSFAHFPLWLSEYGPIARVPLPWQRYTLWQYTEKGEVASDLSTFDGTDDQLRAAWLDTVRTESV
jgi:lysozyme